MPFIDLRDYIEKLETHGEIQRIKQQVDWNLEVGAIIRKSYDLKAPAPLFEKIKDYPEGYKILGAPAASSIKINRYFARIAIGMDLKPDSSAHEIIEEYIKRKKHFPVKAKKVLDGPCKENVHIGDEVDLEEFPAPFLHEGDGGRYIGTWNTIVTKDPETGWVNWGMYRLMIHNRKDMGCLMGTRQHISLHYQKYEKINKPMEFAVVMGTEPITSIISATGVSEQINEMDMVGAIRGEAIEVIKCETVDLEVPSTSEIVIEGVVMPYERKEEGPFGEYSGYRVGERKLRPVFNVKAITHRNNPILPVCCAGVPVDDHIVYSITRAGDILSELRERNFPVRMVYCPPECVTYLTIVSTKIPYTNYVKHLANAVWASKAARHSHYLVIVEDDIDITNINEVMWAITTRCHPDRGIVKYPNTPGTPTTPFLNQYEKHHGIGANVLFDCTWPKDWAKEHIPIKASFDTLWPIDVQQQVLKKWVEYGYKDF